MKYKCFLLSPTDRVKVYLRRYVAYGNCENSSYHQAMQFIEALSMPGENLAGDLTSMGLYDRDDPRWPEKCEHCGHLFRYSDVKQVYARRIYVDSDGNEFDLENPPIGAMYYIPHFKNYPSMCGPDGNSLTVMTPGGPWNIDSQANNCTRPGEVHKCWCRHGTPPSVTVNKNGNTCSAGAGSIQLKDYHGFLTDGWLVDA